MPHRLITTTAQLQEFCHTLSHVSFVAVDTEFIREKTYYPQLCLIQLAGPEAAYAVDPLARGIDLTPLFALMENPDVLKVFHAGRQDIEIFFNLTGKTPVPMFDTQIAAQACGFGESVSYSEMIARLLKITIDKSSRYTDWAKRPLTNRQLTYALEDVIYLRGAYEKLQAQLRSEGRSSWIEEEMQVLANPETYALDCADAWKRLKTGNMGQKQLAVLREVAAWREAEARKRDLPRGRIIRDETLLEIAVSMPQTEEQLKHIRGIGHMNAKWVDAVLENVCRALALPASDWPAPSARSRSLTDTDLVALLQFLLKRICSEHGVTARLVADRDDIEALANGDDEGRLMQGWRREIFGDKAKALLEGKLGISWDAKRNRVVLGVVSDRD